jgi:catechol 2,3-dioxygenase-like lactoylglutathione lyase family enzyme
MARRAIGGPVFKVFRKEWPPMELETLTGTATPAKNNVQQAVPFFRVTNMETSIRYYVEGLGFELTKKWIPKDKIEWCWLQLGAAALMLQEFRKKPEEKVGVGVSVCFQCQDALRIYREVKARGIEARRPFVGNAMWVTGMADPDGYRIEFESPTDVPEETEYSE